jgi:pentatricopeptide repeat protein
MKTMPVVNETCVDDCSVSQEENKALSQFDPIEWQEYESTVRALVDSGQMLKKKDSPEDFSRALHYLLDNRSILPVPTLREPDFRSAMMEQKKRFFQAANMTKYQHELAMRTLTYMGFHCAKQRTPTPLIVAWYKLKEAGMIPRENCISTYMYVLSLQDTSSSTGEVATFHDLLYEPNEKTITLRIKSMIAKEDAATAEQLLGSLPNSDGEWKRLRTYVPVLNLYCKQGDMASALRLYRQMRELPRVHFEPDTYALLIGALAEHGCFR